MFRLLLAVVALIAVALVAGLYLQFDPAWLVLAILGLGIFLVGRSGGPTLPPGGTQTHGGSGHGVYFDSDDVWVSGSNTDDGGAAEDERRARDDDGS